jgi:flagellar biosynthesis chaperone FliJ
MKNRIAKQKKKINDSKSCLFEKMNNIKTLAILRKRKKAPINTSRSKRGAIYIT